MYLILCFHSHQPIGNFEDVFQTAYKNAYKPFIDIFEKYLDIKINLHYSGCLLEWLEENHPEFLERIKRLIDLRRVEILSGGFYEPIFPVIPRVDVKGQIGLMQNFLKRHFNIEPKGFWLAERLWEPIIPELVFPLEYTCIDDTHFLTAGVAYEKLSGYFLTDQQRHILKIFPVDKNLRYLIPFAKPEEVIAYLKGKGDNCCLTMGDDGEKFGLWPGTYKWVYEEGWLESFFALLKENIDKIKTITFGEYIEDFPPSSKVYIPCASYEEMGEWTLPSQLQERFHNVIDEIKRAGLYERAREFLRGGYFRNFFVKYPEGDHLHKRMVFTSLLVEKHEKAKKYLYKAQCNCGYWHGVFGGLYFPHLRKAIYSNLLKAEEIAIKKDIVIERDINNDSHLEIYIKRKGLSLIIEPHKGGIISEIDKGGINIIDIISRRKEAYHSYISPHQNSSHPQSIHNIKKDPLFLKNFLHYDQYTHSFLQDHIFSFNTKLINVKEGSISWEKKLYEEAYKYQRKGFKVIQTYKDKDIEIEKKIIIKKDALEFIYKTKGINGLFAVEFSLSTLDGSEEEIKGKEIKTSNITLKSNKDVVWWKIPLHTVSQSEAFFDLIQQGTIIIATIPCVSDISFTLNF